MFGSDFVADSIFCRECLDHLFGGFCEGDSIPYLPYFVYRSIFREPDGLNILRKAYDMRFKVSENSMTYGFN